MLNMVLRTVGNLLTVDAYGTVAVHATDASRWAIQSLCNWYFFPSPLVLALDQVFTALFAAKHQVMWRLNALNHPLQGWPGS